MFTAIAMLIFGSWHCPLPVRDLQLCREHTTIHGHARNTGRPYDRVWQPWQNESVPSGVYRAFGRCDLVHQDSATHWDFHCIEAGVGGDLLNSCFSEMPIFIWMLSRCYVVSLARDHNVRSWHAPTDNAMVPRIAPTPAFAPTVSERHIAGHLYVFVFFNPSISLSFPSSRLSSWYITPNSNLYFSIHVGDWHFTMRSFKFQLPHDFNWIK